MRQRPAAWVRGTLRWTTAPSCQYVSAPRAPRISGTLRVAIRNGTPRRFRRYCSVLSVGVGAVATHGCKLRLGPMALDPPARRLGPPAVEHRYLVPAGVAPAELDHLGAFPVALPVGMALEGGELLEAVAVFLRAIDRVGGCAVAHRGRRDLIQGLLKAVCPKPRRVPGDHHRV